MFHHDDSRWQPDPLEVSRARAHGAVMRSNIERMSPAQLALVIIAYRDAEPWTNTDGVKMRELAKYRLYTLRRAKQS